MDGWYGLTEHERYMYAIKVRCPICEAHYYKDCVPRFEHERNVGMLQRQYHHTGVVAMHHERELRAKQSYEAEQRDLAAQIASAKRIEEAQIARTCPWCGFLASCPEDLLEHEAGCE